jgi:hypothetical protein
MTPLPTVQRLDALLGGNVEQEEAVLTFIGKMWGARNLARLPEKVANEILRRPQDFIKRAMEEKDRPF